VVVVDMVHQVMVLVDMEEILSRPLEQIYQNYLNSLNQTHLKFNLLEWN